MCPRPESLLLPSPRTCVPVPDPAVPWPSGHPCTSDGVPAVLSVLLVGFWLPHWKQDRRDVRYVPSVHARRPRSQARPPRGTRAPSAAQPQLAASSEPETPGVRPTAPGCVGQRQGGVCCHLMALCYGSTWGSFSSTFSPEPGARKERTPAVSGCTPLLCFCKT